MTATLQVRHNIEVAHRLTQLPGKCEAIHGHSMWVELDLHGELDTRGLLLGLDFGAVKKAFRGFLDDTFDHHLLLNVNDRLADLDLPGAVYMAADPTTENIAQWVADWSAQTWPYVPGGRVVVRETHVNAASATFRNAS